EGGGGRSFRIDVEIAGGLGLVCKYSVAGADNTGFASGGAGSWRAGGGVKRRGAWISAGFISSAGLFVAARLSKDGSVARATRSGATGRTGVSLSFCAPVVLVPTGAALAAFDRT